MCFVVCWNVRTNVCHRSRVRQTECEWEKLNIERSKNSENRKDSLLTDPKSVTRDTGTHYTHTPHKPNISIISFFFFIVVNWWLGMRANTSIRAMTITTRILNIFLNLYSFFNLFVCCFFLFNFVYLTTWLTITIRFWFSLTGVGADNKYNGQWQFFARIKWVNRS